MREGLALLAEPNLQLLFACVVYVNCVNYPEGCGGKHRVWAFKRKKKKQTKQKRLNAISTSSEEMQRFSGKC